MGRLPFGAMLAWLIPVIVVALLLVAAVLIYNRLVTLRNRTENAWSQVDVQLRRRYDLIPNLVETVKGYAEHERGVLEEVTRLRGVAEGARAVDEKARAENALTAALGRLFAVAEAYPQLRATENFQALQAELSATEGKIAIARQVYNDTILTYQNAIQTIPTNLFAALFGFRSRPYFEVDEAAREPVEVDF